MKEKKSDEWDDIALLDPYHESMENGRSEGMSRGHEAGYRDGFALGRMKALEIGVELGYMESIAKEILEFIRNNSNNDISNEEIKTEPGFQSSLLKNKSRMEKIQKGFIGLQTMIDEFPSPDDIFEELQTTKIDVSERMQRIRAKFKLLTVQMKEPHLTLKSVMDEASQSNNNEAVGWSNF